MDKGTQPIGKAMRRTSVQDAGARRAVVRQRRVSLCETLDRVLNTGAVVSGDIVISIAGVDLVYLGVNVVAASVETVRQWKPVEVTP